MTTQQIITITAESAENPKLSDVKDIVSAKFYSWLDGQYKLGTMTMHTIENEKTLTIKRVWNDDVYDHYKQNYSKDIENSFSTLKQQGYIIEETIEVEGTPAKYF